ncbi:MAG: hypothetical protein DMF78_24545 [Acidobacteria bacterium]|nr:MAG: hypothetical protein DMF78_24545 [Acidobacteriota bacterium]
MNRQLVEIVAQYALFLERASESEISLETIVRQQEDLAARLQKFSRDERQQFIQLLSEIAEETSSKEEREILLRLPDDVGIR